MLEIARRSCRNRDLDGSNKIDQRLDGILPLGKLDVVTKHDFAMRTDYADAPFLPFYRARVGEI